MSSLKRVGTIESIVPNPFPGQDTTWYWKESVPEVSIPVWEYNPGMLNPFHQTDRTEKVWSYAAAHIDPICIKGVAVFSTAAELELWVATCTRKVHAKFGKEYDLTNTASQTRDFKGNTVITLMFSMSSYAEDVKSSDMGRHGKLDEHGQSSGLILGKYTVKAVDLSWADGYSFIRQSTIPRLSGRVFKGMIAAKDLNDVTQLTTPESIVTGLFEVIPDERFEELGGRDADVLTDLGNIKMGSKGDFLGTLIWFRSSICKYGVAKTPYQIWERFPLNERGEEVRTVGWTWALKWAQYILRDRTGRAFLEEVQGLLEGDVPETWTAFIRRLSARAPMTGSEVLDKMLPILSSKMGIYLPMIWAFASPDPLLNAGEIRIPRRFRAKAVVGTRLSVYRVPAMVSEFRNATVVGYTDNDTVQCNHLWWKEYFNGDCDGDTIYVLLEELLNESRMTSITAQAKSKVKRPLTVVAAVAKGLYAATAIGQYDALLDKAIEARKAGIEVDMGIIMANIQGVIDSLKFAVDPISTADIKRMYNSQGVQLDAYPMDSMFDLLRGKKYRLKSWEAFKEVVSNSRNEGWKGMFTHIYATSDDADKAIASYAIATRKVAMELHIATCSSETAGMASFLRNSYYHMVDGKHAEGTFLGLLMSDKPDAAFDMWRNMMERLSSLSNAGDIVRYSLYKSILEKGWLKALAMYSMIPNMGTWNYEEEVALLGKATYKFYIEPTK
jgi:hypothetical protein